MPGAPAPNERKDVHEELMALAKRRGFVAPSYEIYGGVAGFYDYGPMGAAMKNNLQQLWRRFYVLREGMAEIECPTISPEQVFRASGHLEKFADTVVECPECGAGMRGDHLVRGELSRIGRAIEPILVKHKAGALVQAFGRVLELQQLSADKDPSPQNIRELLAAGEFTAEEGGVQVAYRGALLTVSAQGKPVHKDAVRCVACGKELDVRRAKISSFNLMFKTQVGPGSARAGYLRPETAQGMFMDFPWLLQHFRQTLPFGAVQIGRAYRNEISPRQAMLRLREFSQMEAEVFFDPQDKAWPGYELLAGRELNLLVAGEAEARRWKMGEAVAKGVIANGALGYFLALTDEFLEAAGLSPSRLRFRQHEPTEKAHYSTDTWDAEFLSPRFGWVEIVGIADRTDYDLRAHERVSGVKLRALRKYDAPREVEHEKVVAKSAKLGPLFKGRAVAVKEALEALDPETVRGKEKVTVEADGERFEVPAEAFAVQRVRETESGELYTPHVVEPSYGVDRILYALLESAYAVPGGEREWATLKLSPQVAPVKVGVFPLMGKDGLDAEALRLDRELRDAGIASLYDDSGSIGKRYARMDEIGTPWCVTVDYETLEGQGVTIRDRDTGAQTRVPRERAVDEIRRRLWA